MSSGQIEFVVHYVYDRKISPAAVVIEAVADVGELLKGHRSIVLKPQLNVLVGWERWPRSLDGSSSWMPRRLVIGKQNSGRQGVGVVVH